MSHRVQRHSGEPRLLCDPPRGLRQDVRSYVVWSENWILQRTNTRCAISVRLPTAWVTLLNGNVTGWILNPPTSLGVCSVFNRMGFSDHTRYKKTPSNASDNPLCSTKHFWLPLTRLVGRRRSQSVALCSQTVARGSARPKRLHFVHKLFANSCRWQKTCKFHVPNHPRHSLTS